MKVKPTDVNYPKDPLSELEKYKNRLLEEDRPEEQRSSMDIYSEKPIEQTVVQLKRTESVSPVLKKLLATEHSVSTKPLEIIGSDVVGGLFDRKRFLAERIKETETFVQERRLMHENFNKDISVDIADLEKIIPTISDREELREFKINLNLMKMEKRKEGDLFWRDMVTLRSQLRELKEQFEMESKISKLFSDLDV